MAEAAAAAAAGGAGGGGGGGGAAAEHEGQVTMPGEGGLPKVVVRHHSGAEVEVYLHGATVTSYKGADGQQLLFVSSRAVFDGVKAIRGGIPIVFPQFGAGALPQHGFARNKAWTLVSTGDGAAELTLADDDATRAVWPHAFKLTYRIAFDGYSLTTTLEYVCGLLTVAMLPPRRTYHPAPTPHPHPTPLTPNQSHEPQGCGRRVCV